MGWQPYFGHIFVEIPPVEFSSSRTFCFSIITVPPQNLQATVAVNVLVFMVQVVFVKAPNYTARWSHSILRAKISGRLTSILRPNAP